MFENLKQTYITIFAIICVILVIALRTYSFLEIQSLREAERRTELTYTKAFRLNAILLFSDALILALILFCIYLLNRQLSFRTQAEKKVRESEEKLYHLAYYDPLTGLPNRLLIMQQIDFILSDLSKQQTLVVMMLDIDNFKHINDTFSHEMGDQLLRLFAVRLKKVLRHNDLLSHVGGDNFVIVLPDVTAVKDINLVSKKIQDAFHEPLLIDSQTIYITLSIGISIYPNNGMNAKTLIKNADIAMYHAKEMGRNNYQFCTPAMSIEVEKRALLQSRLHQALKQEEFTLLYQPKFSLQDNKIIGFEVLMRWMKPDEGLILPDYFIGIAESNGLIVPIGEWMLHKVCHQIKNWQQEGIPIKNVAINISMRQFTISDFVEIVRDILTETKIDPGILEFEITERVLIEHSSNNFAVLRLLKNMGIKITLDDFGTGYSSLSYLSSFDIDKLKIDKSFIQAILNPDSDTSIIKAIIVMSHSLDIKVIAEGVETPLQVQVLKKYGCDEVQGFLYSRPLSETDAQNLLRNP